MTSHTTRITPAVLREAEAAAVTARVRLIHQIRAALNTTLTLGGLHRLIKAEELVTRTTAIYLDALGLSATEDTAQDAIEDLADAAINAANAQEPAA